MQNLLEIMAFGRIVIRSQLLEFYKKILQITGVELQARKVFQARWLHIFVSKVSWFTFKCRDGSFHKPENAMKGRAWSQDVSFVHLFFNGIPNILFV